MCSTLCHQLLIDLRCGVDPFDVKNKGFLLGYTGQDWWCVKSRPKKGQTEEDALCSQRETRSIFFKALPPTKVLHKSVHALKLKGIVTSFFALHANLSEVLSDFYGFAFSRLSPTSPSPICRWMNWQMDLRLWRPGVGRVDGKSSERRTDALDRQRGEWEGWLDTGSICANVWRGGGLISDETSVDSNFTQPAPGGDYPEGGIWVAVGGMEERVWQITWSDTWGGCLVPFCSKELCK